MITIVELPPAREGEGELRSGYKRDQRECFMCWRDFWLLTPIAEGFGTIVVIDVPCPHCHRYRAEVRVSLFQSEVLVQAIERTWAEWHLRSMRRAWRDGAAFVRTRAGRIVRAARRLHPSRKGTEQIRAAGEPTATRPENDR